MTPEERAANIQTIIAGIQDDTKLLKVIRAVLTYQLSIATIDSLPDARIQAFLNALQGS